LRRTLLAVDERVLLRGKVKRLGIDAAPVELGLPLLQEVGLGCVKVDSYRSDKGPARAHAHAKASRVHRAQV
jgi:hypothetical protein